MQGSIGDKVYDNQGNPDVVAMVSRSAMTVLDVGCGAGSNAALLRARDPHKRIFGITGSPAEASRARAVMEECWVADLELPLPDELRVRRFDCILLSHVLEHLRDPAQLLAQLSDLLTPGGQCVIAVPNVLYWRERVDFLRGRFEYQASGTLDETHLRFFTHDTADRYLLAKSSTLQLVSKRVTGSVPLWLLRKRVLSEGLRRELDALGCRRWPNLFGTQILLDVRRPV